MVAGVRVAEEVHEGLVVRPITHPTHDVPNARDLAPLVQDLVTVLDNLSGTLSAGKYPEGHKGKAIAAALRKVADELDA